MPYITDIDESKPATDDKVHKGDDEIREFKSAVKDSFPNIDGKVQASRQMLNRAFPNLGTTDASAKYPETGVSSVHTRLTALEDFQAKCNTYDGATDDWFGDIGSRLTALETFQTATNTTLDSLQDQIDNIDTDGGDWPGGDISKTIVTADGFSSNWVIRVRGQSWGLKADGTLKNDNLDTSATGDDWFVNMNTNYGIQGDGDGVFCEVFMDGDLYMGDAASTQNDFRSLNAGGTAYIPLKLFAGAGGGAANNITLGGSDNLRIDGLSVGTGTPTKDRTVAININGTVLYFLASTQAT